MKRRYKKLNIYRADGGFIFTKNTNLSTLASGIDVGQGKKNKHMFSAVNSHLNDNYVPSNKAVGTSKKIQN